MASNVQKTSTAVTLSRQATAEEIETEFVSRMERYIPRPDPDPYGMLIDILNTTSLDALVGEQAEHLPKSELVAGRMLRVRGVTLHDSTLAEGLPYFVVVDSTDIATGEIVLWQTNATTIVGKLVQLAMFDAFPAIIELRKATKATRAGYFPMNCIVHDVTRK